MRCLANKSLHHSHLLKCQGEKTEKVNLFQPRNNCTATFTLLPQDEVLNEILYFGVFNFLFLDIEFKGICLTY